MSGSITGATISYGHLSTLIANTASVHQQLDKLTEQASTGLVAQTYAGLGGNGANISLNLNPQLSALQTDQKNISQATATMQVTQTAMTQIQQIAAQFVADIPKLNNLNPSEVDSVAAGARQALTQVAGLLNTQQGSTYVFGGQDSTNPPVASPNDILSLGFYTQIKAAVTSLSTPGQTAAAITQTTLNIASSNALGTSPFSPYMSSATISAPVVQTGEGGTVQIGLVASANSPAVVSTGTSTTGSYMRDLMRALATLGSLSSSQANDPGFASLVQDTGTSLNGVVSAMATDVGVLGNTQSNLTAIQTQLTATTTALTAQVSNVQDADMATTLSNLTATQTQLQASYRLITAQNSLSLVNFMPATA